MRLPPTAHPLREAVDLTLSPTADRTTGAVTIEVELAEPTTVIWLNSTGLELGSAYVEAGAAVLEATIRQGEPGVVGVAVTRPVGPGHVVLGVSFSGHVGLTDADGIFREAEDGAWYLFSQFEPTDARRAFPCFDDPAEKIPWRLTLHVPNGNVALANVPALVEAPEAPDRRRVEFGWTPPLPSYLVAFAVGPFELVPGGRVGRRGVALRVAVPHGRADEAEPAAATTRELLGRLEDYFDMPYPYEKLDAVAVPRFFGGEENAGLVMYSLAGILPGPGPANDTWRRHLASLVAHELAHQWLGDLVTMAWWDDLWLKEAFASFVASRTVEDWRRTWNEPVARARSRGAVMRADGLVAARAIRQPIRDADDIADAFDDITYDKGRAVLEMLEAFVGGERFTAGIRRYLHRHAHATATTGDFASDLAMAAGGGARAALSTFLDRPGVPLVTAALSCLPGAPPRLALSQTRHLPAGSRGELLSWAIPICARYPVDGGLARSCTLLASPRADLVLDEKARCPAWVLPNADARGYYHVAYRSGELALLLGPARAALTAAEVIGIVDDVVAGVAAGRLPIDEALALVPNLARDADPYVVAAAASVTRLLDDRLVPPELEDARARFVVASFGAKARALGWRAVAAEDEATRMLRTTLVPLVAETGHDAALTATAVGETERLLSEATHAPFELKDDLVATAVRTAQATLLDRLEAADRSAHYGPGRDGLVAALGLAADPQRLARTLGRLLVESRSPEALLALLGAAAPRRHLGRPVFDLIATRFDTLLARLPREEATALVELNAGLCTPGDRAAVAAFFGTRVERLVGGRRALARTLEGIDLCIAFRAAQGPAAAAFLAAW